MTLREGRIGLATLDRNAHLELLLIEDPSAGSELVRAMLEHQFPHARVQVETSLDAAMARLGSHRFDLVLVDLSLPGAGGAPIVRTVHPEIALMALTGRVDGDVALWVLAEGAQDCQVEGQHDGPRLVTTMLRALQCRRAEAEAHRYLELARGLLDASEAPTCAVDPDSVIVAVNQAWRDFTGHNGGKRELCGVGTSYLDTCDWAAADGGDSGAAEATVVAQGIRQVLAGSLDRFFHDYPCHSPGENRWFSVQVSPAVINDGRGAVITHHDVTDMHEIQESMAHRSVHDALTDLPNRVLMLDRLEQALSDADRHGLGIAVTHLDLHRYQQVNDLLGYHGGDAVLVEVAGRLQAQLRPGDTLARPSGDEFVVLWRDLDPNRPDQAVELSAGLVRALDRPFEVEGAAVSISASAGVTLHTPGQSVEELMRSTDAALHDAKRRGPGRVVLFTEELRAATTLRRSLEAELRLALEGAVTQFVLHYQPVVELSTGNVVAVESLVRWQHPVRGLLGPDRFIALAESTGLMHQLGGWVLDQAMRDAAYLTHRGRELDVAVNVSVQQLGDQAVEKVRRAIENGGLRPARLILEVTESVFVEDEETTAATLAALSALGVRIAIDDFGTGYSSLLYVRRYPVDTLKIDREFVAGIGESEDDEAICGSITSLAAAVGASTIGEGVETMEQYAALRSLGCLQGQGFLWSPAVPLDELGAALASCDTVPVPTPARRSRSRSAPVTPGTEVRATITRMHAEGASPRWIAAALNRTAAHLPKGVRWTAGSVARGLAG